MKILHVVHSDAFYGVERYVSTLARAQAARGDAVTVIGGDGASMRQALAGTGVRSAPGDSLPRVFSSLASWRGADVIHAHMTDAELAVVSTAPAISRRSLLVATRHFARHRGASRLGRLAAPFIARGLEGQIAISRYVADRVEGESVVIHPGVPSTPAPAAGRQPIVLVAQRLEAEKATEVAVEAFAASGLANHGWRLRIAGDGALRASLQALGERLGLGTAIEFLGRRSDVPELMASSSLLLATTPIEAFGLTVAEAMAAGLPVVAARAGGHLESLPSAALDHGFEPGDAAGAAHALRGLAENASLRTHVADAELERHRTVLTPQVQAARTADFYAERLARR